MKVTEVQNRLRRFRNWIASPPYYGVPWMVWLYAFFSLFTNAQGQGVLTGHLIGHDDKVRMVQVLNWINGAGWYDRVITRADPPEGFETIWTRIVDIPIALVVLVAQQFTDQKTAALIASVVVPYAELAIMFVVAIWAARPLVGKNNARLVILFLMFTSVMNQKPLTYSGFYAGEASHRCWYILLNVLMYGAAARAVIGAGKFSPALMMGLAIGLSLAVGIEGFPMIAGIALILAAIAWWFRSPGVAKRGALAIGCGAACSLLLLPMHQPPEHWLDVSFTQPSILGPVLVGAAALYLAAESWVLARLARKEFTLVSLIALAGIMAAALVWAFPQILDGPAAGLSSSERELAHFEHPEAWPMYRVIPDALRFVTYAMPTIMALVIAVIAMRGAPTRRRRMLYASYFGFAALGGVMSQLIWRYYHHALTAACPWLLWAWKRITARLRRDGSFTLLAFLSFVAIGPFWLLLLPAIEGDELIASHVLFFPVKPQTVHIPCDILRFSGYLNSHYDSKTDILVPDWYSEDFIYYTDLTVDFISNFPSQDKFIDNKAFFITQDPNVSAEIALRHNIGLVAVCPPLRVVPLGGHGQPTMMDMLSEGRVPGWLKPVDMGLESGGYLLYAVDRSSLLKEQ